VSSKKNKEQQNYEGIKEVPKQIRSISVKQNEQ
jgi:hypothetical protein